MQHLRATAHFALLMICCSTTGLAQDARLRCAVSGPPAQSTANIDPGGLITLSNGAGNRVFAKTYSHAPLCNCIDETSEASVSCSATRNELVVAGNASDTIAYTCSFIRPVITPVGSKTLPTMVNFQGFSVAGAEDARWFFDTFSWDSFLAINQAAQVGTPKGDHAPRVWEAWDTDTEIFPAASAQPVCPDLAKHPDVKVFSQISPAHAPFDHALPGYNQAFTYPLFDQSPTPIRYEVHVNPTGAHTILANGWNSVDNLPQVATFPITPTTADASYSSGEVSVVSGSNKVTGSGTNWSSQNNLLGRQIRFASSKSLYAVTAVVNTNTLTIAPPYQGTSLMDSAYTVLQNPDAPYGIMEIKAAWRELTSMQQASRYYWEPAYVLEPGSPQSCRFVPMMGLVGLHIAHKASQGSEGVVQVSLPEWVWSTFEQIDNVPDGTTGQVPDNFTLNCQGQPGCQQPTAANGGYNYQGVDGGNPPVQCSNQSWPEPMSPVNVIRLPGSHVAPVTNVVNQVFRRFLGSNSVWSNYQLISTQWPVSSNGTLLQESLLASFNNLYPLNADCPFPVDHAANVTSETYAQSFSCIGCHYTAQTQNTSNTKIVSWTDFSMLLPFAGRSSAQAQGCTPPGQDKAIARQPGMPRYNPADHWRELVEQMENQKP
jgi:hypothetical protein